MIKENKIKGMICTSCVEVLNNDLSMNGITVREIELGRIVLEFNSSKIKETEMEKILQENDFEIIHGRSEILAEETKKRIIHFVWNTEQTNKISEYLSYEFKLLNIKQKFFSSNR